MGVSLPDIKMYNKVPIITIIWNPTGIDKTDYLEQKKSTEKVQQYSRMYCKIEVAFKISEERMNLFSM